MSRVDCSSSVIWIPPKKTTCGSGKLRTELTSLIAKSTGPRLSDTTFFARWFCVFYLYIYLFTVGYSKPELGTINMLYFPPPLLKQVSYYTPTSPLRPLSIGAGHPVPEIRGAGGPPKKYFPPFGPHFGRKIRGGQAPWPLPSSTTAFFCPPRWPLWRGSTVLFIS